MIGSIFFHNYEFFCIAFPHIIKDITQEFFSTIFFLVYISLFCNPFIFYNLCFKDKIFAKSSSSLFSVDFYLKISCNFLFSELESYFLSFFNIPTFTIRVSAKYSLFSLFSLIVSYYPLTRKL